MTVLDAETWQRRAADHRSRVEPWVAPRRARRARGERHIVDDFLFEYYPYSPSRLQTWHPGCGVTLLGDDAQLAWFLANPDYVRTAGGVTADASRLARHRARLHLVQRLLQGVSARPTQTSCFGMHEWAMVYGTSPEEVRHAGVPLRLEPDRIRATVDDVGLRCTHIDAYRFFTPEATPRNAYRPTRKDQVDLDQSGCLHVNMDLYKYAMWFRPFVSSERIADAFDLAREARELDMRASPYDLSALGYDAIALETSRGRAEYAMQQRALTTRAEPVRKALLGDVERLLEAVTSAAAPYPDSRSLPDPMPA